MEKSNLKKLNFRTKVFRFVRDEIVIFEGQVESLKKGGEFVATATKNTEVGISLFEKDVRFQADDGVEVYEEIVTSRVIDWNPPGF